MFKHKRDPEHDPSVLKQLQDGIYYRHEEGPAPAYRVLLLDVKPETPRDRASADIEKVWTMLQELRDGKVRELRPPGEGAAPVKVKDGNLTCLLGFGARLFARDLTPNARKPAGLVPLSASAYQPFPSLRWAPQKSRGEADLAIQFIADTELAVNRAVVEVYRLITLEDLKLEFVTFYGGFNRDDGRSWLGFFDGVGNIKTDERPAALEVAAESARDPGWMVGGTYMVFLRLGVKLEEWWKLTRPEQELRVGRDKLSGCPIIDVGPGNVPVADATCPASPKHPKSDQHTEAGPWKHVLVALSHMRRANPTRRGPGSQGSNRIFRQGYEFLEPRGDGRPRTGLNFVSFQCDLERFTKIMTTGGWLNGVNFGGPDDRPDIRNIELAEVIAGGYYAVPPRTDQAFPGAEIFR